MKPRHHSWMAAALLVGCATGKPDVPRSPSSPTPLPAAEPSSAEPPRAVEARYPAPHDSERTPEMTTDIRSFGRALGETARAVQKVHLQVLAREGSDFESWVMYLLLTEQGAAAPKDPFLLDLARRIELDPPGSRRLLDRFVAAGHVRTLTKDDEEMIELTPAGQSYFARLREAVGQITHRLVGPLDPLEVATTLKVLHAVRAGAEAL